MWDTVDPLTRQCNFEVIQCTCFKIASYSKSADGGVKQSEFFNSGMLVIHLGYLWPCSGQDHFRIIQWLTVEPNGVNMGLGVTSNTCTRYFWPRTGQGHFGVIRCTCLKIGMIEHFVQCFNNYCHIPTAVAKQSFLVLIALLKMFTLKYCLLENANILVIP